MECRSTALHHHAGTLMAGPANRQRVMLPGVDRPIAMPDVAAADRHPLQLDEALAIRNGRHLYIDELEEFGTYQLCRFHNPLTSYKPAGHALSVAMCTRSWL